MKCKGIINDQYEIRFSIAGANVLKKLITFVIFVMAIKSNAIFVLLELVA